MIGLILSGLLVGLLFSAYYSGMETGYYSINRLRVSLRVKDGEPGFKRVDLHLSRSAWLLTVLLLGNNIANYMATWCGENILHRVIEDATEPLLIALNTLLLTPLLFLTGEVLPKTWFRMQAEQVTPGLARGITLTGWFLWPLVQVFKLPALFADRLGRREVAEDSRQARRVAFKNLLSGGGEVTPVQKNLASRVTELHAIQVVQVMDKLKDVSVLPENLSREELLPGITHKSHQRFPVHATGDRGRIIGYVHLLDLLFNSRPNVKVGEHLRELEPIGFQTPLDQALVQLQRSKKLLALVINGQGEGIGIVTLADLVEKILVTR